MGENIFLSELKPGEKGRVLELLAEESMNRRLQDIGLIAGTEVECIGRSPLGDPAAYEIRRAVIALRTQDSRHVRVEKV